MVIFTARNTNIYKLHMAIYIFILQHLATNLCSFTHSKGPVIIYGGGGGEWYRREMFFVGKSLLTQPLKSQKCDYHAPQISIKK